MFHLSPLIAVIFSFSVGCFLQPLLSHAGSPDKGCYLSALEWIDAIEAKDPTVLKTHASAKCRFAEKWIRDFAEREGTDRQRLCNDLVLIWTHKECIYFRDYVHHSAYAPCKTWSREMFQRCMNHDDQWFTR